VKLKTKIDLTHVPLGSESAAATAVLGGHVNIAFLTLGTTRSHIEAGTMRALAVASNRRLKDFPNVPTTVEKGFSELNLKIWVGFFAPAKNAAGDRKETRRGGRRQSQGSGDRRQYREEPSAH
jgi:tripartite-type tricarboxylate transporter receptor subunit TctC